MGTSGPSRKRINDRLKAKMGRDRACRIRLRGTAKCERPNASPKSLGLVPPQIVLAKFIPELQRCNGTGVPS